jgi:hypothetical protein
MSTETRGINEKFATSFKKCELYKLYQEHKEELFIGVRNNYLNLYYNCDSIAKVKYNKNENITCEINKYYLNNIELDKVTAYDICKNYDFISANSDEKATPEKKAQSKLCVLNNNNPDSKWYCLDVEWEKAFENQKQKDEAKFNGRIDIIAISKEKPNKVALIELKYGNGAIGGKSGIYKHIADFKKYQDRGYFDKQEICDIISSQKLLGVDVPQELNKLQTTDISNFEFYIITLNNNADKEKGSTPKQTMAGYLFKDKRWGCKKLTTGKCVEKDFGDVTDKNNSIHVNLLFSYQTLPNLDITDILNDDKYEKI